MTRVTLERNLLIVRTEYVRIKYPRHIFFLHSKRKVENNKVDNDLNSKLLFTKFFSYNVKLNKDH